MKTRLAILCSCASLCLLGLAPGDVGATVTTYFNNLSGYLAASGGNPSVCVDFEGLGFGTNITGQTISNIHFDNDIDPAGFRAPLIVENGSSTSTPTSGWSGACTQPTSPGQRKLNPTSGNACITPGGSQLLPGPNPTVENDDLEITFPGYAGQAVKAVGFDLLFQSLDGDSFVHVQVFDGSNTLLADHFFFPIPGVAGDFSGSFFVGFVSTTASDIARVVINEQDDNNCNPDSNIGYDTIRCKP